MEIGDWITLISAMIVGLATMAAVVVALGIGLASLWQTQSLQKRERKERLLNEIIEWATETIEWDIEKDYFAEKQLKEAEKPLMVILMQIFRLRDGYFRSKQRGKLILIPLSLGLKQKSLIDGMEGLLKDLQKHMELLCSEEIALMRDISVQVLSKEYTDASDETAKHKKQLDKSASTVISEAITVKNKS